MSGLLSRRMFLTRRSERRAPSGPRPPWSITTFSQSCDGCGACIDACPEAILVKDSAGLPIIDFERGGCTFCGDCDTACGPRQGRPPAIDRAAAPGFDSLPVLARLGGGCISLQGVSCRLCGDPCAMRAIRFVPLPGGRQLPEIDGEACNGCGACVPACPVGALAMVSPVQA